MSFCLPFCLTLCVARIICTFAQSSYFSTDPDWLSGPTDRTYGVALGDVDGDGDLDLVCGNYGQKSTLYLNDAGTFRTLPSLPSGRTDPTQSVTLGDVNGDGDLDLVCGNYGQKSTLYLNEGGKFQELPSWLSERADATRSVALGDVDRDGDLDLVCGNYRQKSTLYLNEGGKFQELPSWYSLRADSTQSVALGDVDGDGNLDLVCGNYGQKSTLYLNEGGKFQVQPSWSSGRADLSWSVALGDVDGNGDLDLVCGNQNQSTTLYLNEGGMFRTQPSWFSGRADLTRGVALADADGDGDLDLVCGNFGQSSTLYLKTGGGRFETLPSWPTGRADATRSVTLGDVDGDGDLDLVCGNYLERSTLYLSEGGTFEPLPSWHSEREDPTGSVALGDVDGDGDLDLVCGNYVERSTLYLNESGMFRTQPSWYSGPTGLTWSVALGDVDGDGSLDLVCGNYFQKSTLYLNEGGVFRTQPSWQSGRADATRSVALGDADGDGDLDLVCGNEDRSSTLYVNEGGMFRTLPSWYSFRADSTWSVALGDVDGDGDLDLVCGNVDQSGTVYVNEGGMFQIQPSWSSGRADPTWSVALGDVDGDGDLDLVCGNVGQPSTLYRGKMNPVYTGNPSSPTRHLPNNSSYLNSVRVEEAGENLKRLNFTAIDVESDPVWVVPEYQYEGAPIWSSVEVPGRTSAIGPFPSSPRGEAHAFEWDISRVDFDRRGVNLRLRAIEIPKRVSIIRHVASHLKAVGPLNPFRARIDTSPPSLNFPTVTVGDTVEVKLAIWDYGNAPLEVRNVVLPSTEMDLDISPPFTVQPADTIWLTVRLAPVTELSVSDSLRIFSTDPFTPVRTVEVTSVIRALRVSRRLLPESARLGDSLTVIVTPESDVSLDGGNLHYTVHPPNGGSFSTPLRPVEQGFRGTIPGQHVTEAGLDYYLELWNLPAKATDPLGAPDSVYRITVPSPNIISSVAQPDPALENNLIRIEVHLQDGAVVDTADTARVYYRTGGGELYDSVSVVTRGPALLATIPAEAAGPRGVEYWVKLRTLTRVLTDPSVSPAERPNFIPVRVRNLAEPNTSPGGVYRMVSVPLDFGSPPVTLESLLYDQSEFGTYDIKRWRAFRYVPSIGRNVEFAETSDEHSIVPGKGFWLICSKDKNFINTYPEEGVSTATDSDTIALSDGWNMIGNPFAFPVAWDSVRVDALTFAEAEALAIVTRPRRRIPSKDKYNDAVKNKVTVLEPFEGYWVYSDSEHILRIRPSETGAGGPSGTATEATIVATAGSWYLRIGASSNGIGDPDNYAGVAAGASGGRDRHDVFEPPPSPGRALGLYFVSGKDRTVSRYTVDARAAAEATDESWGHIWNFDVLKTFSAERAGDEVLLVIDDLQGLPHDAQIRLIDRTLGRTMYPQDEARYVFYQGERELVKTEAQARFILIVGNELFIEEHADDFPAPPTRTVLHQNFPNPFNPSTIIAYEIAERGNVSLRLYDAQGALVKTLYDGERGPGRYETGWDGENERGENVASGIYFSRLTTSRVVQTRKLVFLK